MITLPAIDNEFAALIPPLLPDELIKLEESIVASGRATDPLKTWRSTLVDGHNRLAICQKNNLPFTCEEISGVDTRDDAIIWIERNQLGRRNLTDDQRALVAQRLLQRETARSKHERAKTGRGAGGKATPQQISDRLQADAVSERSVEPKETARSKLAREAKVSERKIREVAKIAEQDPGAVGRILRGESTIREERAAQNKKKRAKLAAIPIDLPSGEYHTIVIDPPWPIEKIRRDVRPNQVGFDYPTMSEAELAEMKLPAGKDCHLFLWTTCKHLFAAGRLLKSWQFKYICPFVWHKKGGFQPFGLPQYNCEFALYARRGSPKFVELSDFKLCFEAERRAHSRKPEFFYDMVKRVTRAPRIDMFAREKHDGFTSWGNESEKFTA